MTDKTSTKEASTNETSTTNMPQKKEISEEHLKFLIEEVEHLSTGAFKSWYSSSLHWILGGGTTIALADWWIRWWSLGG